MKLRRSIVIGVVAAATVGALTIAPAVATLTAKSPAEQTLRDLGKRHDLYIGTAVNSDILADATQTKYQEIASKQFSTVTAENVMKWEALEPTQGTYDWTKADAFIKFAQQNHQLVRGHVLVWHNQLPKWLTDGVTAGTITKAQVKVLLKKHITDVVTHFRGKIWQWDVVNEAVSDPWETNNVIKLRDDAAKGFWYNNYGPDYIADAFRFARAADPRALLFYNDYNLDAFGSGGADDKSQFVFNLVKGLKAKGVPIDGVGSQGHLSTRYGNFDALQIADWHNKMATLGVATAVTEADVRSLMTDLLKAGDSNAVNEAFQAQASNYSALLQGCLASRHCLSFTVWGFDDKNNWTTTTDLGSGPGGEALAAIYDANFVPKRAFNALKADLAFSGAPYVLDRIPQRPTR
jgi:endo-1,4-beta-xylanase